MPLVMRQSHAGGEKLFLDYAGDMVPVEVDRRTGEVRGAHSSSPWWADRACRLPWPHGPSSSLTESQATMPPWPSSAAFPQLLELDNAKVAVIKACHYDPQVNRSYIDMARRYGTAILPTRPRKPRDKVKVEACVDIVERWLLGRLRNRIFYGLADLNDRRVLRQLARRAASCSTKSMLRTSSRCRQSRGLTTNTTASDVIG